MSLACCRQPGPECVLEPCSLPNLPNLLPSLLDTADRTCSLPAPSAGAVHRGRPAAGACGSAAGAQTRRPLCVFGACCGAPGAVAAHAAARAQSRGRLLRPRMQLLPRHAGGNTGGRVCNRRYRGVHAADPGSACGHRTPCCGRGAQVSALLAWRRPRCGARHAAVLRTFCKLCTLCILTVLWTSHLNVNALWATVTLGSRQPADAERAAAAWGGL